MSHEIIGSVYTEIIPKEYGKNSYYINSNKIYKTILKYKYYHDKLSSDVSTVLKNNIISHYLPENYKIFISKSIHTKQELQNVNISIIYNNDKDNKCVITEENPFKISCMRKHTSDEPINLNSFDLSSVYVLKSNTEISKVIIKANILGSQVPYQNTKQKIFNWIYNHQVMNTHTLINFVSDISKEHNLSLSSTLSWIREELQAHNSYNMNSYVLNDLCNFLEKNINIY